MTAMMKDSVLIVGSASIDLFNYVERFPLPGETLFGTKHMSGVGGKGSNQAAIIGKLQDVPGTVCFVGCVGDDSYGNKIKEELSINGIDISRVKTCAEAATGVATITVNSLGENQIILCTGANMELLPHDIDDFASAFANCRAVVCQNEIKLDTTRRALKIAKDHGKLTILNPAPYSLALAEERDVIGKLTDILIPNETEAAFLLNKSALNLDLETAIKEIWKLGDFDAVVLTAGSKGALVLTKEDIEPEWIPPPCLKTAVVDTTGAGDAFVGAFTYSLITNVVCSRNCGPGNPATIDARSVKNAVRFGCVAAALSVLRIGCQKSYPSMKEIKSFSDSNQV